ncbi:hypothetical protein ACLB2K_046419 [Fragaria x ananassa]
MVFCKTAPTSFSFPATVVAPLLKEKRMVTIREVSTFPPSTKITCVRRGREDDEAIDDKRPRYALSMVPLSLNSNELGFSIASNRHLRIIRTRKSLKKKGSPCGNRYKKKSMGETLDSMAPGLVVEEKEGD